MSPKSIIVIMSIIMLCASLVYGQSTLVLAADQSITEDQSITSGGGVMQREKAGRSSRFTDNGNGTVTDNDTGLIWLKDANCFGLQDWLTAMPIAATLSTGSCGLLDGSAEGDWRLPTIQEWEALVDQSHWGPALPSDYPFTNVQLLGYWSSSTSAGSTSRAWLVDMIDGVVDVSVEVNYNGYVWPVRAEQQIIW